MKTIYWIESPWEGQIAIIARPRGNEWLEGDLARWRQQGIDAVVSLLTFSENNELGLANEATLATNHGIQFYSLPIFDRAVPSSLLSVRTLAEQLTALLSQGKNVGIHCRQGVGRSALLAASLLVCSGIGVERAFQLIEAARSCPVPDTLEQREWVAKFAQAVAVPAFNQ